VREGRGEGKGERTIENRRAQETKKKANLSSYEQKGGCRERKKVGMLATGKRKVRWEGKRGDTFFVEGGGTKKNRLHIKTREGHRKGPLLACKKEESSFFKEEGKKRRAVPLSFQRRKLIECLPIR